MINRRGFFAGAFALAAAPAWSAEPPNDVTAAEDFDELWRTLGERYCFFGDKTVDWNRVRARYRPLAIAAGDLPAFSDVVRQVLGELYDAHTHLSDPAEGAPRWPMYDLLVEAAPSGARIVDIKDGSAAQAAGLAIGDVIRGVGGTPVVVRAAQLGPKCLSRPDPSAQAYALNCAVSGLRGQPRRLDVTPAAGGAPHSVDLPLSTTPQEPDVSSRRIDNRIGLIRISSFGNLGSVDQVDQALLALRDTDGLILDVRRNGGGDTAVAKPIMGRFITQARPYAHMRRRQGAGLSQPWTELVEPRGPFSYAAPVVVLCDHWSGSMAEGFPMGMRGIGRARVVGTPMMGLGAAVFSIHLDRTGVSAQYSGEPVYDVAGAPRWLMRPDVETRPGADVLAAGLTELRRMIAA